MSVSTPINLGTNPDDGTGDPIRTGGTKINTNFTNLNTDKLENSLFNENTILATDTDDTPAPLTVGLSTFVGRRASGNISALTPAQAITELSQATNVQTGTTYTITASDNGKTIAFSNVADITVTVPENSTEALVAGFQALLRNDGSSTITLVKEGADVIDGETNIGPSDAMSVHLKLAGTPNTYFTLGGTPATLVQHTFFVNVVANQDYIAFLRMNFSGKIINVATRSIGGTCTLTTKLRDAADVVTTVTATANSVSQLRNSQAVTGLNTFVPGDDILLTASGNSGCTAMSITFDLVV